MDFIALVDLVFVALLGLCLGSFSTAITYRELHDLAWLFPAKTNKESQEGKQLSTYRSACPQCFHPLSVLDLIPVFSWLFLRGRCRYCSKPIGMLYPLLELGCLNACLLIFFVHGLTAQSLAMMVCVPFLAALIVVDLQRMILPNMLVLLSALCGVGYLAAGYFQQQMSLWDVAMACFSAFLYGGFSLFMGWLVSVALKKEALGMGDVKFFAVAGLWLGGAAFPAYCILSGILGIVVGLIWQWATGNKLFPFGPALILSLYVLWLIDGDLLTNLM